MTYYGRWTYKFEEAARQGAAAVFIVHDTEPASYGWNVVQSSWGGPLLDMQSADDGRSNVPVQGWLSNDAARRLLAAAGRSEEHTSELQSLMRISYAVFCLKKKKRSKHIMMQ